MAVILQDFMHLTRSDAANHASDSKMQSLVGRRWRCQIFLICLKDFLLNFWRRVWHIRKSAFVIVQDVEPAQYLPARHIAELFRHLLRQLHQAIALLIHLAPIEFFDLEELLAGWFRSWRFFVLGARPIADNFHDLFV